MSRAQHSNLEATETLPRFPNWARQSVGFGTILVAVTIAFANVKSDVRDVSTRSEQRELRLQKVEDRGEKLLTEISEIKADVRYMRQAYDRDRQH